MKTFNTPEIERIVLAAENVMTLSGNIGTGEGDEDNDL